MGLRWIVAVCFAGVAFADTSTPPDRPWASCTRAIEAAKAALVDDGWSVARDGEVTSDEAGVELSSELGGWCMHHGRARVRIERRDGAARRWRVRGREDGFVATRRRNGRAATLDYFDHDESESGSTQGFDEPFRRRMQAAAEICLGD